MNLIQNVAQYDFDLIKAEQKKYLNLRIQTAPGYPGTVLVAKYSKKAFYDQAWKKYPILCQARGHIFDSLSGNIITRPFDKVFNYGEENAGSFLTSESIVRAVRKVNGFLGCLTRRTEDFTFFQSSGSVEDSNDFVRMFKEKAQAIDIKQFAIGVTYMFEVVHENDPHIIQEEPGLYLIGARDVKSGVAHSERNLDVISRFLTGVKRYESIVTDMFDLHRLMPTLKTEGFMLLDATTGAPICKWKSPYYLSRKLLARAAENRLTDIMADTGSDKYDEEVLACVRSLKENDVTLEEFMALSEEDRLKLLREIKP